jgi:hypothetical protein
MRYLHTKLVCHPMHKRVFNGIGCEALGTNYAGLGYTRLGAVALRFQQTSYCRQRVFLLSSAPTVKHDTWHNNAPNLLRGGYKGIYRTIRKTREEKRREEKRRGEEKGREEKKRREQKRRGKGREDKRGEERRGERRREETIREEEKRGEKRGEERGEEKRGEEKTSNE